MSAQPNILWIYCDELRTDALGCYGNRYFAPRTPNIDSIADAGVRFDNCFCNSPVCVPSRVSVKTGLYPEDTGVYHNEAYGPQFQLDHLPLTFPQVFAEHDYTTANFGKTHIPHEMQPWQVSQTAGSEMKTFFQGVDRVALHINRTPGIRAVLGGSYPTDRPYPPDQVAANAMRWLGNAPQPFLSRVSFLQPHTPVLPQPPFDTLYAHERFPDALDTRGTVSMFEKRFAQVLQSDAMSPEQILGARVHYYGLVAWVDTQVGQILNLLRQRGLWENTIIIFESDHGVSLGEMGRYQKQTFAPESQRVPRLIAWHDRLPKGQVRTDICESLDLARTLFAMTGIDAPAQFKGRDLFSAVASDAQCAYSTIGYGFLTSRAFPNLGVGEYVNGHGWPRRACIRTARYRFDKNTRLDGRPATRAEQDWFLADMQADPDERHNLANAPAYAQVVADLNAKLDAHIANAIEVPEAHTVMAEFPGLD